MSDTDGDQPASAPNRSWGDVAHYAAAVLGLLAQPSAPATVEAAQDPPAPQEEEERICIACGKPMVCCRESSGECESDPDTLEAGEYVNVEHLTEQMEETALGDGEEAVAAVQLVAAVPAVSKEETGKAKVKNHSEAASPASTDPPMGATSPAGLSDNPEPSSNAQPPSNSTPSNSAESPARSKPPADKSSPERTNFPVLIPPSFVLSPNPVSPLHDLAEQTQQFLHTSGAVEPSVAGFSGPSDSKKPGSTEDASTASPQKEETDRPDSNPDPHADADAAADTETLSDTHANDCDCDCNAHPDSPPHYAPHTQVLDVANLRVPPTRTRRRTVTAPARVGSIEAQFRSVITRYPGGGWRRERVIRTRRTGGDVDADEERLRRYIAEQENPWHDYKWEREE
ncbi:hypothetical protein A1Q1_00479 [Trichosporon asahii var. asahii CBS 2479]|uniref:Uncharacterized protein n=1 Tax=Trichosporon asahii var. asahii (strain ATCC 90039 / CBS 2479 / JCM 2466 / KCTC 7840 / NBRC 103889/ NCYC 2677 / UAMH 7654) TaxID=1186058 RepID=J6F4Q5_TRIAS|nr:hypothetical protein A1Q1_00479 [Trichosporon asahii var. asahii CBS 2479]EJT50252.1 hypothetical protein A1Q1_00479 [Trichosporon asahii var. asahii CBS 2479]